jgi:hypothetical protein
MRVAALLAVIIYASTLTCGQASRASGHVTQNETPISRRAPIPPYPGWKPLVTLRHAVKLMDDYVE